MNKRSILAASWLALAVLVPPAAVAKLPTRQHARQYTRAYYAVQRKFGRRAPGRQILRWGFDAHHKATDAQVVTSLGVLDRMLHPPPVISYRPAGYGSSGFQATSTGQPSGGVPACASESGTNYSTGASNTNASSGATGRYQILPSTHASVCPGMGWSPAEQDQCASRIYAAQGSGAWVGCG